MPIIKQKDKKSGRIYVYEAITKYDPEKKCTVYASRKLIGHVDPKTNQTILNRETRPYRSLPSTKRDYYGSTYLLNEIAKKTGVYEDLKTLTPCVNEILSLCYYMICEDNSPIYRFSKWGSMHWHPHEKDITSQQGTELFSKLDQHIVDSFCRSRARRQSQKDYWYYDISSISSYSEMIDVVKYGHNKENKNLPQINLAVLTNEKDGLPFYYRYLSGNISDVSTILKLIDDINFLGEKKIKIACDRGFMSINNINALIKEHIKFLIGVRRDLKFTETAIREYTKSVKDWKNLDRKTQIYMFTAPYEWNFEKKNNLGEIKSEVKRTYIHLYYSVKKAQEDTNNFDNLLITLHEELETKNLKDSHEKLYEKYFIKHKKEYRQKTEAIDKEREVHGYFVLFSNDSTIDAKQALKIYRAKGLVEKCFTNIKSRLDFRTQKVSSEKTLSGKLFCVFVSLILISWLNRKMQESNLNNNYTLPLLLDELNTIERYSRNGKTKVLEVTKKQADIFKKLGVQIPK